jgi:DNA repair protein RecN (Recombination protein N)
LLAQREQTGQRLKQTAQALHVQRLKIAQVLSEDVNQQLQTLLMTGAKFEVRLTPSAKFLPTGHDDVAFYMQTNVGEGMAPLVKIASGGEAARVMLALKTTFARSQKIISIVFDEADTGVSGRVAQAMAKKMQTISQNSQVLAITHLPQVAAVAQHHLLIAKHTAEGRTVTHVTPLRYEERIPAIALMLSGEEITQTARDNAKALLNDAHQGEGA